MSNGIRQKLRETCRDECGLGLETDGRSFCGGVGGGGVKGEYAKAGP